MNFLKGRPLARRTFLKGAAGAVLGLPILEAMLGSTGEALADGTPPPKRFLLFFFGNGVRLARWNPAQTGANWSLSEELAPLANVKPYVNVVSGYRAMAGYGRRGHHDGCAAILSGIPFIELPHASGSFSSKFGGPTIDQVVAQRIGAGTTFPSLELGVSKRIVTGEGPTLQYISHRGPDAPVPAEFSPARLYARLFHSFTPKDPTDPKERLRVSVLDAVAEDTRKLQRRLGAADRARLEQHLTSISELRQQVSALPPVLTTSCVQPSAVTEQNYDSNGVEPLENVSRTLADLVAVAFACDLTRVVSMQFTGSVGGTVFSPIGITGDHHAMTHDDRAQEDVHKTVVWTMRQFAYLAERLKASMEAGGNLLDNSLLMATSDCAEGLTHSSDDYPVVFAGKAGGAMKYPGVHHRGSISDNTSDILLSAVQAVGTGLTSIGSAQGYSNAACRQILA